MKEILMRARWGAYGLIAIVLVVSGGWLLRRTPAADGTVYQQARLFEHVLSAIHQHYIDSLGEGELYRDAAAALVSSLKDPYAELLIGESYQEYRLQMAGNEIGALNDLALGEREIVRRVGPTTVHVSAASRGVLLKDGVGYVALLRVSEGAAEELRAEIDSLIGQGMTALVLDLRLNPGGLISEGAKIAGLFLEPGDTVAVSQGRNPDRSKVHLAEESGGWGRLPLVLLVNRGTASSSELVAGALQDHDRAVIVGTPTYGKGVLQTTYPLGERVAIKLTTARWYAPSGRNVQRPRADSVSPRPSRSLSRPATPAPEPRVFRTASGRMVSEASGIVPDLIVRSARSESERSFLAALGVDLSVFRSELAAFAGELAAPLNGRIDGFEVTSEMLEQFFQRLVDHGVDVPREAFDAAAGYVGDQLDYEVARLAVGPGAEARQRTRSDRQLQAALVVLQRARTQEEALALAAITRRGAR